MSHTIRIIAFIKEIVKDSAKRDESLKKCLPIAQNLAKDYEKLEREASTLKEVSVEAMKQIEKDNLGIMNKVFNLIFGELFLFS